jgi:hypothetical protein
MKTRNPLTWAATLIAGLHCLALQTSAQTNAEAFQPQIRQARQDDRDLIDYTLRKTPDGQLSSFQLTLKSRPQAYQMLPGSGVLRPIYNQTVSISIFEQPS